MRSRYVPWFLIFALVVLVATLALLFFIANPGQRMPPISGDEPSLIRAVYPLIQTTGRSRATRRASPARSADSTTLPTSL